MYGGFVALNYKGRVVLGEKKRKHCLLENSSKKTGKGKLPKGLGSGEEEEVGKKTRNF